MDHQGSGLWRLRRPTRATPGAAVVLLGDQMPVPSQDRVRCDEARILPQQLRSEELPLGRQSASLVVGEADMPTGDLLVELLAENAVLLHEVRDDILLAPIHPPGERQQEEL